jgi:branched-chain amino acid transport system ATP-binding protein
VKPDAGTIRFRGRDITGGEPYEATRLGIGRTFQVVQPLPALTVRENVMLGTFLHHPRRKDAADRADQVLEFMGMRSPGGPAGERTPAGAAQAPGGGAGDRDRARRCSSSTR